MTVKSEHNFQKVSLLETGTKSLNSPNPTCLILALPISHKKAILVELYKLLFLLYYYYKQYIYILNIFPLFIHIWAGKKLILSIFVWIGDDIMFINPGWNPQRWDGIYKW